MLNVDVNADANHDANTDAGVILQLRDAIEHHDVTALTSLLNTCDVTRLRGDVIESLALRQDQSQTFGYHDAAVSAVLYAAYTGSDVFRFLCDNGLSDVAEDGGEARSHQRASCVKRFSR